DTKRDLVQLLLQDRRRATLGRILHYLDEQQLILGAHSPGSPGPQLLLQRRDDVVEFLSALPHREMHEALLTGSIQFGVFANFIWGRADRNSTTSSRRC